MPTKRLPDELRVGPLRTADEARKWIGMLHRNGLGFHFDDDPAEIISIETNQRIFHDDDLVLIRARVAELFDFDFDPFAFALCLGWASCMSHEWDEEQKPNLVCVKCGYDKELAEKAW